MKPKVDASDKEIFMRNRKNGVSETLQHLINPKDRVIEQENAFLPNHFGSQSDPKEENIKVVRNHIIDKDENAMRDLNVRRKVDGLYQQFAMKFEKLAEDGPNSMNARLKDYFAESIIPFGQM